MMTTSPGTPVFVTPSESTPSHHDAWMAGTDSTHFIYLAASEGLVGYDPTPLLFSKVGERIYLKTSGNPVATVTAQPAGVVQIHGLTVLAIGRGTAMPTTDADCAAVSGTGSAADPGGRPSACLLMEIIVS